VARILEAFASQPSPVPARQAAAQALREHSLPTRQDENWRYANLRALEGVRQFLPDPEPRPARSLPAMPEPLPGFERLVYIDGRSGEMRPRTRKARRTGRRCRSAALPASRLRARMLRAGGEDVLRLNRRGDGGTLAPKYCA
jgi:hypothetical protein